MDGRGRLSASMNTIDIPTMENKTQNLDTMIVALLKLVNILSYQVTSHSWPSGHCYLLAERREIFSSESEGRMVHLGFAINAR